MYDMSVWCLNLLSPRGEVSLLPFIPQINKSKVLFSPVAFECFGK